jgi:hypothetical protein
LVSPVTAIGADAPVLTPCAPPLLDVHVAVNDVIALPLAACDEKPTDSMPLPLVTAPIAGAFGTAAATMAAETGEGGLVPTALVALTVHR